MLGLTALSSDRCVEPADALLSAFPPVVLSSFAIFSPHFSVNSSWAQECKFKPASPLQFDTLISPSKCVTDKIMACGRTVNSNPDPIVSLCLHDRF